MGSGFGCQRNAHREAFDGASPPVLQPSTTPHGHPSVTLAFQKLQSFYDQEKPFIPKKVEPYYRCVLANTQSNVTEIVIKVSNLGLKGVEYLCRILPFYTGIEELRLWKVGLDTKCAESLAYHLPFLTSLKILALEDNALDDEAITGVAKSFKQLRVVKELWIGCNVIGPKGAAQLAEALQHLVLLEVLCLDFNELRSEGCAAICSRVSQMQKLSTLSLESTSLDSAAVEDLAHLGRTNPPSKRTNLKSNRFSDEDCRLLTELFPLGTVDVSLQIITILQ